MMKHLPPRKYCEVYGISIKNRVMENFLAGPDLDFAISGIIQLEGISKPKVYQVIDEFLKKGYVVESRIIGRTQLYKLNKENPVVKIFLRNFKECLNMVFDGYAAKKNHTSDSRIAVSAKSI